MRRTASAAIGALLTAASSNSLRRACAQQAASRIGPGSRLGLVEPVEPGIGVRLQDAGEPGQVALGMLALAIGRVEERHRRRIGPAERPVVPDIAPQAADLRPLLGQHRHRGVVAVQPLGREDVGPDRQRPAASGWRPRHRPSPPACETSISTPSRA